MPPKKEAWETLVMQQLKSHDSKLDKLIDGMGGLKAKVGIGAGVIAAIVSMLFKYM